MSLSVALVGCTGSGKTALACSAMKKTLAQPEADPKHLPTLSATQHTVPAPQSPDSTATMQVDLWETPIWDLTLDPKTHFHDRGRDGIVFVVDCTRRESLDEVLLHWLHIARYHSHPGTPFLFVGTKVDITTKECLAVVEERLSSHKLPHLLGSSQEIGSKVVGELLKLRAAANQPDFARKSIPLLSALPNMQVPFKPEDLGGGVKDILPSHGRQQTMQEVCSWHIPKCEVTPHRNALGALQRIDGPDSAAWRGRGGRSPSFCAIWRGATVVAKDVDKELLHTRCGSDEELHRLLAMLAGSESTYLARFYGACLDADPVTLVMEYMPGGDLERYLRSKRTEHHRPWVPPRDLVFRWAIDAASALQFLASLSKPVVHGNVRPSNFLLDTNLDIKLSPSGVLSPVAHRHKAEKGDRSLENCLYSAPEVLISKGEHYTEAADVFAFGLVLWFICTGTRPLHFLDNDGGHAPPDHIMQAFASGEMPRPDVSEVRQGPLLRAVIQDSWHKDAARRPPPQELLKRLQLAQKSARQAQCCSAM